MFETGQHISMIKANVTSHTFDNIPKNELRVGDIFYTIVRGSNVASECWVVRRRTPQQMWAVRILGTLSHRTQMHPSFSDPTRLVKYNHLDWTPDAEHPEPDAKEMIFHDRLRCGYFYNKHLWVVRIDGLPGRVWPQNPVEI